MKNKAGVVSLIVNSKNNLVGPGEFGAGWQLGNQKGQQSKTRLVIGGERNRPIGSLGNWDWRG